MHKWLFSLTFMILGLWGCSPNNVTKDNSLKKYFDEANVDGCFGMFDNGQGDFTIYHLSRFRDSTYLPAGTFDIVQTLIGLQTGTLLDSNTVIPYDSAFNSPRPGCNTSLAVAPAFRMPCTNWYRHLARMTGRDTLQKWIDTLGYGRRYEKPVITEKNLDSCWLDDSIRVTADEQLGLVKRLYFGQLPFQQRPQRIVTGLMLQEKNANYKLSYTTGTGISRNGHALGWLIGWIEENRHPYFFVLQLDSPDRNFDMPAARIKILKDILRQWGFMQGKK